MEIRSRRRPGPIRELLETIVIALALALLIRGFVLESFLVQGSSMEPTLQHGNRLLVNKITYRFSPPQRGDIIVFHAPPSPSKDYVKRLIAVAGDRVRVEDGVVFVNGEPLDEPYVAAGDHSNLPEQIVPPGSVFVLGDNRARSQDSREFGFVRVDEIVGEAFIVYWPPDAMQWIHGGATGRAAQSTNPTSHGERLAPDARTAFRTAANSLEPPAAAGPVAGPSIGFGR